MSDFEAYLDGMLHERPVMSFERYGQMVHQGAWPDIVEKAKRLIQNGQVTVLRNAPHHVMAHVIGDHGEYNTEISRTDPASNVIEQWSCECPWDQFAFNRTRRWKKFEGRVCSHALATYWKGLSTPLDFQPDQGGPPPGQNQGPAVDRIPAPGTIPPPTERSFGPETPNPMTGDNYIQQLQQLRDQVKQRIKNKQPYLPGENQNLQLPGMRPLSPNQQPPSTQELIMGPQPETPFRYPEMQQFQRDNLHLFDLNAPPWNPTPVPPQLPVSVPNADPPDAMNPIDGIGFSSIRMIRPIFGATDDDFTNWFQTAKQRGRPTYGQVVRPNVYLEARGGKMPMPGAEPYAEWPDGTPRYRKMDLGYDPATDQRMRADQSGPHGPGAPEQRGVFMAAPLNSRCEVTEIDPMLKWCHIIVPIGNASFLEPNNMEGWVSYADVKPLDDANNPFIRRRGASDQQGFAPAILAVDQMRQEGVMRDFTLIGSVAAMAYLPAQTTEDMDIVVLCDTDQEYMALLNAAWQRGQMEGMHVILGGVPVQMFPTSGNALYADTLANARPQSVAGQQVKVASPEHLIVLALVAFRPNDYARAASLLPVANRDTLASLIQRFDTDGSLQQRLQQVEGHEPGQETSPQIESKRKLHAKQASLSFDEKLASLDRMLGVTAASWDPDWWRQDQEHDEPHTMAKQILQQADADLEQKHTSMSPDQFWPYLQQVIQQILEQWKTLPDVPSDDPYEQSVGRGQFDFYRNMEADSIQDSTDLLWEFRREWSERIRIDFLRRRTVQVIPSVIDMMLNLRQAFQEGQWEQALDAWEKVEQFIRGETQDFKTLRDQAWHGNGAQWEGATDDLKKQLGPLYDVMSTMTYIPSSLGGYVHSFLQWAYGTGYQPDDVEGWREHHTDNITMQNALGNLSDDKVEPMFGHLDRIEKEYGYIIEQIDALMQMLVTAMQTEQEALPAQAADTFPTDWLSKRLARWNQLKS